MAFVPYGVAWPTLIDFQCQYQGTAGLAVVMGAGGPNGTFNLQAKGMDGFDLQATRSGDPNRPRQRGQFIGLDLFSGRDITLTMDIGPVFGTASTTVASGSNGGEISTIASWGGTYGGSGVLKVANTSGFAPTGTVLHVAASGSTTAIINYTGITSNSFTGCSYVSGSPTGTVSTGGVVTGAGAFSTLADALNALRAATNTADNGNTEYPLWVKFPNQPLVATMARVRRRSVVVDLTYSLGNMAQGVVVQWHATDPYFYSVTQQTSITIASGSGTFVNAGDVECWPTCSISGAITNPGISIDSVAGTQTLIFNLTMHSGDTLVVDMDLKTATYTPSGGSPVSVVSTLNTGWAFGALQPGFNTIYFTGTGSQTLVVDWANAYSSAT